VVINNTLKGTNQKEPSGDQLGACGWTDGKSAGYCQVTTHTFIRRDPCIGGQPLRVCFFLLLEHKFPYLNLHFLYLYIMASTDARSWLDILVEELDSFEKKINILLMYS